ncbi:hypothetical protein ACM26W_19945 [Halomonas sp. HK25]|uniref:hypothetical protein n=1 Tax=Halomonas sp. HK25 TaxID=3394321 RepID=UPI0039FCD10A
MPTPNSRVILPLALAGAWLLVLGIAFARRLKGWQTKPGAEAPGREVSSEVR